MSTDTGRADDTVQSFVSEEDLLVNCQGKLKVATEQIEHVQTAQVNAQRIGAAIGIIMTRMKLTDDQAFELLREISQRCNRKLREIADDVLYTGALE